MRRAHDWSMPHVLLIHLLPHRALSQRPAIITLVAANPPFLDPFFLDVRLAAFRAEAHSLFIVHEPFFLHCLPRSLDNLAQGPAEIGTGCRPIASRGARGWSSLGADLRVAFPRPAFLMSSSNTTERSALPP